MSKPVTIMTPSGEYRAALPKAKAVHPFGSKILVDILRPDEIRGSNVILNEGASVDGAPQAYILELGPNVEPNSGLSVGQRVYWTGRGTEVKDPREDKGRVRALLEISNILAVIEEESLLS